MSDVAMADEEKQGTRSTLIERLSDAVFEALKGTRTGANVYKHELDVEESFFRDQKSQHVSQTLLTGAIFYSYSSYGIDGADVAVGIAAAMNELQQVQSEGRDSMTRWAELEPTAKAFAAPYVGDADAQFQAYLATCLSAYRVYMSDYTTPYVTITQSSGFGKSRILQRLAETTAEGNCLVHNGNHYDVTVFYVCARNIKSSTRYPRATSTLLFKYALEHPDSKKQWKELFNNGRNGKELDGPIVEELKS
ncbi:hypothetical protein PI125_g23135, partial [Phytophthora idaei]